jgi:hypothetical protein
VVNVGGEKVYRKRAFAIRSSISRATPSSGLKVGKIDEQNFAVKNLFIM